jgi:hypothetical protein
VHFELWEALSPADRKGRGHARLRASNTTASRAPRSRIAVAAREQPRRRLFDSVFAYFRGISDMTGSMKRKPVTESEPGPPSGFGNLVSSTARVIDAGRRRAAWSLNAIISPVYWDIGLQSIVFERAGKHERHNERVIKLLAKTCQRASVAASDTAINITSAPSIWRIAKKSRQCLDYWCYKSWRASHLFS